MLDIITFSSYNFSHLSHPPSSQSSPLFLLWHPRFIWGQLTSSILITWAYHLSLTCSALSPNLTLNPLNSNVLSFLTLSFSYSTHKPQASHFNHFHTTFIICIHHPSFTPWSNSVHEVPRRWKEYIDKLLNMTVDRRAELFTLGRRGLNSKKKVWLGTSPWESRNRCGDKDKNENNKGGKAVTKLEVMQCNVCYQKGKLSVDW